MTSRSPLPSNLAALKPVALLLAAMGLAYGFGVQRYLSFEHLAANKQAIEGFVASHAALAALAYFALYTLVVALSLPVASFLTLFGGLIFGPLLGGSLTVAAATLGAFAVFLIARTSLGETLAAKAGPWLEKLRTGFSEHALNYMLFLRLVPLFPFWLVNIAPALLGVPTAVYLVGTLIGIIPVTYAFAYVGAGLGSVIDAQKRAYDLCIKRNDTDGIQPIDSHCSVSFNPGDLVTPELLAAFVALGCVALIPVVLKKLKQR